MAPATSAPAALPSTAPVALPSTDAETLGKGPPQYGAESAASDDEGKRARAILDVLAARERNVRLTGAYTGLALGAVTLGISTAAELQSDRSIGAWPWIVGGSFVLGGVTSLVTRGPLESLAATAGGQSDGALRASWETAADCARSARLFGGWMNTGLGTAALATGSAIAFGAADMTKDQRTAWSVVLLAGGGAVTTAGIISLLVKTDIESGFQSAYGGMPHALSVGAAPLPGGGAISLSGKF